MNHLTEKVQIVADDRERPSGVISELEKLDQAIVKIDRLSLGDYLVDDAILIERKSARDFAESLIERRLFGQASRLVRTNLRPAYIIEGTSDGWSSLQVPRSALQGALITLSLIFDIPIFRSFNVGETARLIAYIGQQLVRLRDPNYAPYRHAKAKRRKARQLHILESLPGIGNDRAKRLLAHFGTVRACLDASQDQLQEVSGIGPKTAETIHSTVN
jgi:DNA excision repair protein ERCC-4